MAAAIVLQSTRRKWRRYNCRCSTAKYIARDSSRAYTFKKTKQALGSFENTLLVNNIMISFFLAYA